jgi:Putative antitoxin of bacterial toxin-antitoxin system, YdaS/YdaT
MTGNSNPIVQIVALFGGQTKLARLLQTGQATVWDWVEKGRVPSSRIPTIIALAAQLQPPVILEPNDFFDLEHQTRSISRPSEAA